MYHFVIRQTLSASALDDSKDQRNRSISSCRTASHVLLICLMPALITVTGCSTAEITQLWLSEPADIAYTCLELDIDLGKKNETEKLTNTFVRQLKRYHIDTSLRSSHSEISNSLCSNFAILKIREIKREYVTVRYIRGLASPMLTQMRGRRYAQKPIITISIVPIISAFGITFSPSFVSPARNVAVSQPK